MIAEPPPSRVGAYLATWLALVVLAGSSLALSFAHLGALAMPVALAIAGAKAALVAIVFMHLRQADATMRLALIAAATFVVLLSSLAAADVRMREQTGVAPPMDRVQPAR